jgi:hypothetical protein
LSLIKSFAMFISLSPGYNLNGMRQMCNLLMTITVAAAFFGLAMLAMAVGLMLRGKIMRGGCGSHSSGGSCDACSQKKSDGGNNKLAE